MATLTVRFLHGQHRGRELRFSESRVRIGRSRDNDLVLPEGQATSSGHHAELTLKEGRWWLSDLGSTNGTYVNEERLAAGERRGLRNGDRLGFGGAPMLRVVLPQRRNWLPMGAVVLMIAVLALVTYRELGRDQTGFDLATARVASSVYLVALEEQGTRRALASAFAVTGNGLLATTAHVAEELEKRGALSSDTEGRVRAVALLTDSPASPLPIVDVYLHPGREPGSFRNDVALLQVVTEEPLVSLPLADPSELAQISRGVAVGVFGFPARATDARQPRGRFIEAALGDVRAHRYLEIGPGIAPGMSGSPIFTEDGKVVGVVVGGELGEASEQGKGNWGLSVDALREMLAQR
jgi:FHA domain/Trypsin-like peptidase domain